MARRRNCAYAVLDAQDQAVSTHGGLYGTLEVNDNGTYDYVPDRSRDQRAVGRQL